MTKEITELLQWLNKTIKNIEGEVSTKELGMWKSWATAVEQLQEEVRLLQKDLTEAQNDLDVAFAESRAYERILDKGITVNVYDPNGYKHRGESGLESLRRGESEDKVENLTCVMGDENCICNKKVEKPTAKDFIKDKCNEPNCGLCKEKS